MLPYMHINYVCMADIHYIANTSCMHDDTTILCLKDIL